MQKWNNFALLCIFLRGIIGTKIIFENCNCSKLLMCKRDAIFYSRYFKGVHFGLKIEGVEPLGLSLSFQLK